MSIEKEKNLKHVEEENRKEFRREVLERARARALLESLGRSELGMDVSKPWQIGRGIGVGDRVITVTPRLAAKTIKEAKRPLLVLGPLLLELEFGGKPAIDYAIEIARAVSARRRRMSRAIELAKDSAIETAKVPDLLVVATGHVAKALLERGFKPDACMPLVNIVDRLKDPEWKGIRGEGQHDVVAFFGISSTIATQGLSTLKHFAPNLKTITLCPIYYPTACMPMISPPFMPHCEKLDKLIEALKE